MELLAEGVESLKLACSLVLLVPAIGVLLLGTRRRWLIPAWIVTVAVIAWLRFALWWNLEASGVGHVLAGVALIGAVGVAYFRDEPVTDLVAAVGVAILATWTWEPCVGRELGEIVTTARFEPWGQALPTLVYFVGLFLPLVVLAAIAVAAPKVAEIADRDGFRRVGLGIIALVGGLVAVTLLDDLAGELARRSSF